MAVGNALHRAPGVPRAAVWGVRKKFQTFTVTESEDVSTLTPLALGVGRTAPELRAPGAHTPAPWLLAEAMPSPQHPFSCSLWDQGTSQSASWIPGPSALVILCLRSHRGKDGFLLPEFTRESGRTLRENT